MGLDAADQVRPPARTERGTFRYARWDGSQRLDDLSADDILAEMSDDLLAESDLNAALARLLNRGLRGEPGRFGKMSGLNDLLRRLGAAREDLLSRYQLNDVLSDIRQELDEIVASERRAVERRLAGSDPAADAALQELASSLAERRQRQLEAMPEDVPGRIRALTDYDFMDPDARERFDALARPAPPPGARRSLRRPVRCDPRRHAREPRREPRDGARAELAAPGAAGRRRAGRRRLSCRATAACFPALRRSTTSSSNWLREWPRCSRSWRRSVPSSARSCRT